MDKYIIAVGGGELKSKETLKIDRFIAELAKKRAGERRAYALFIGTASHDSMPYYNTFHKTYTGEFGLKTDCALTVYGEMDYEKIKGKFLKADMIYVGGGDTVYMLQKWKESGVYELIMDAYERGVIISGLSAGAICWFGNMYTDSKMLTGKEGDYDFAPAMGVLRGCACPHYDERKRDILSSSALTDYYPVYCIENNAALVFKNGELLGAVLSEKNAYILGEDGEKIIKNTQIEV